MLSLFNFTILSYDDVKIGFTLLSRFLESLCLILTVLCKLMSSFDVLLDRVRASRVFRRNRVALEVKVFAALLYFSGLSWRLLL